MLERYKIKLEKILYKYKNTDSEFVEDLSFYEGQINILNEIISDLELQS